MSMNEILYAISNFGFSIVVAIILLYKYIRFTDKVMEMLEELRKTNEYIKSLVEITNVKLEGLQKW